MDGALGAQHREVKRLRELLRDRAAREAQQLFVIDGPRAVDGALDCGAPIRQIYVADNLNDVARSVVVRATQLGVPVTPLLAGVAERVSDVRHPAGVFALCATDSQPLSVLDHGDLWIVLPSLGDPGNLGTILRAAVAFGASGIGLGRGSVDVYNPKVVRASAGAVFGVPIVEGEAITMLERLGDRGVLRLGAMATGECTDAASHRGPPVARLDQVAMTGPIALVLGHETRGIGDVPIDRAVAIPIVGVTDSLNVAMAATVLLYEAARQRGHQHVAGDQQ